MDYMEGVKALVCGMTTVFAVLIIIAIIIDMFKYIQPKKVEHKHNNTFEVAAILENAPVSAVHKADELELVAVITASIAASLNTTADKLVVTSFKKVNSRNNWANR